MTPSEQAKKLSDEKKCVVCKKQFSRLTRGLCSVHHAIWLTAQSELNEQDASDLEEKLICEGKLLPDGRRKPDQFAEELAQYVLARKKTSTQADEIEQEALAIHQRASELTAKEKKPRTKKQA